MSFFQVYIHAFVVIVILMTSLWLISVIIRNVSIVDLFWGFGFVVTSVFYFINTNGTGIRKIILVTMVGIWGLRLSIYLAMRNLGKGEDFRYQQFRKNYGENRYWWISFFQVFLLQGILMWIISVTLLGAQFSGAGKSLGVFDYIGIIVWFTGFLFETGGDLQLARFRADHNNKGKVLDKGFWRLTRHPNYFGDSAVWWGYGLISVAAGNYVAIIGSVLMTALIIKVSGVVLLEKTLKEKNPGYKKYMERTSAFIPWFPKK
jgi:steroid 5-alpha reductase family enzyme